MDKPRDATHGETRKWIANKLAALARRIYPKSQELMAFYTDRMLDTVLTGKSFIKVTVVDPTDMFIKPTADDFKERLGKLTD